MIIFTTKDFNPEEYKTFSLFKKKQYSTAIQITCVIWIGDELTDVLVESLYDSRDDFIAFDILPENWNKEYIIKRLEKHFDEPVGIISKRR